MGILSGKKVLIHNAGMKRGAIYVDFNRWGPHGGLSVINNFCIDLHWTEFWSIVGTGIRNRFLRLIDTGYGNEKAMARVLVGCFGGW